MYLQISVFQALQLRKNLADSHKPLAVLAAISKLSLSSPYWSWSWGCIKPDITSVNTKPLALVSKASLISSSASSTCSSLCLGQG